MSAKKIKQKSKTGGASQLRRKSAIKRIAVKQATTGHRRLPKRTNASPSITLNSFALKPVTKQLLAIDVLNIQGAKHELANSDEQLKCLEHVHKILTSLGGKIDLREKSPSEALEIMMKKINDLQCYEEWSLKKEGSKYVINGLFTYGPGNPVYIQIDFLAQINRTHTKLHDLIVYALVLVANWNRIPLLYDFVKTKDERGHHGMFYEYAIERMDVFGEEDKELEQLKNTLEYYGPKGIVSSYHKHLEKTCSSLRLFEKEMKTFKPNNQFEIYAEPFLRAALALAKTKRSMHDLSHDLHGDGMATPIDYMRIVWCYDEDDFMFKEFCDQLDMMAQSIGSVAFNWTENLDGTNTTNNKENIEFADLIIDFFDKGFDMANRIKSELKGVSEQPLPTKSKRKNGRLIDIIV